MNLYIKAPPAGASMSSWACGQTLLVPIPLCLCIDFSSSGASMQRRPLPGVLVTLQLISFRRDCFLPRNDVVGRVTAIQARKGPSAHAAGSMARVVAAIGLT